MKTVVGCFIEYDGKFLILKRKLGDSHGGKWGLPAGGIKQGETPIQALTREIKEETGIDVNKDEIKFVCEIITKKGLKYFTHKIELKKFEKFTLDKKEHQDFRWVTPEKCHNMENLIHDFQKLLEKAGYVT